MLHQFSTTHSVMAKNYDGMISVKDLKAKGNFGLGTFDKLYGELVAFDGEFFHTNGNLVTPANDSQTLTWAMVCDFASSESTDVKELSYAALSRTPSDFFSVSNITCIKISGCFDIVKLTSIPEQKPPLKDIHEIVETAPHLYFPQIEGTIVGYFVPKELDCVNTPGLHLHFVSNCREKGGHVLDFYAKESTLSYQVLDEITLKLRS